MASPKPADYDFVEEPAADFYCPVTFDLLRDPHQTLCCGNHLSQETVTRLQEERCPICKTPKFGTLPDKFFKRRVSELKLYCPNKSLGCEWVGELGDLDQHLKPEDGCQYAVVTCEFSYAGCKVALQRQLLQAHLADNVEGHLSMVSEHLQLENQQQQHMIAQLQSTVLEQKQHNKQLQATVKEQQRQIDVLISALGQVPIHILVSEITMTDFQKCKKADDFWFSPPFYSHIGGYKMCLGVYANGRQDGRGTHVSMYVNLMRGEYDDQLQWPFRGDITIELLNQRHDEGHLKRTVPFDDRAGDEYAARVVGQERTTRGWGYHKLIAHSELSTERKTYLKTDCLKFRVSKIVVKSM